MSEYRSVKTKLPSYNQDTTRGITDLAEAKGADLALVWTYTVIPVDLEFQPTKFNLRVGSHNQLLREVKDE